MTDHVLKCKDTLNAQFNLQCYVGAMQLNVYALNVYKRSIRSWVISGEIVQCLQQMLFVNL